jgi:hypothetical protein
MVPLRDLAESEAGREKLRVGMQGVEDTEGSRPTGIRAPMAARIVERLNVLGEHIVGPPNQVDEGREKALVMRREIMDERPGEAHLVPVFERLGQPGVDRYTGKMEQIGRGAHATHQLRPKLTGDNVSQDRDEDSAELLGF